MEKKTLSLAMLKGQQQGKVVAIGGGAAVIKRLEAMGIRVGHQITKLSSQMMHGPVTVKIGHTVLAIGHGMADKILIEVQP